MSRLLSILLASFIPFFVIILPVRAVFSPWLVHLEYSLPGFPPDPVAEFEPQRVMAPAERLRLGIEGLQGTSAVTGHAILSNMHFDNGQRVFDDREVKHLDDVRSIITIMFPIHTIVGVAALITAILLARRSRTKLGAAVYAGAWLTISIVGVILVAAVVGWDAAFTAFHRLFFTGDSWLFNWDDALIRLYPVEFWQVITALLGLAILAECGLLLGIAARLRRIKPEA